MRYRWHRFTAWTLAGLVLAAPGMAAQPNTYPDRPIRLIVPSPPGGGTDASTRVVAPKLADILGQNIVIDNRGGASGNLGAEMAAHAPPDGYTLLAIIASHTSNPAVMRNVPFDLARDFAPISRTVVLPNLVVTHPTLPVGTAKELIAYVQSRPGAVQFASGGIGSIQHFAMELFIHMAKLKMIHVPYKGVAPATADVIGGHVPVIAANILTVLPHVRSNRLRAHGVTSSARSNAAPEIPTIAEAGLTGYEAVQWYGLVAPAKTPAPIVNRLHAGVVQALNDPDIRARFQKGGADPAPSESPAAYATLIRAELRKWADVAKAAGITPE